MALMKVVPIVPGHFTIYEWMALAIWILLGRSCSTDEVRRVKAEPLTIQDKRKDCCMSL